MRYIFASTALAMSLVACGGPSLPPGQSIIEVTDGFIMEPAGKSSWGGFTVLVDGEPVTLTAVSSAQAKAIELHTNSVQNGKAKMRRVEGFTITPDAPLELGGEEGHHLMVFGLDKSLKVGDTIDLVAEFELSTGGKQNIAIDAEYRALGSDGAHDGH